MIAQFIGEGEMIPRWWAIAYRDFDRGTKVAYPIPLHFLVRWERDLRYWLMSTGRPGYREKQERIVYLKGREDADRANRAYTQRIIDESHEAFTRGYIAALRKETAE